MYFLITVCGQKLASSHSPLYLKQSRHKWLLLLSSQPVLIMILKCHVSRRMILKSQTSADRLVTVTTVILSRVLFTGSFPLCLLEDVLHENVGRTKKYIYIYLPRVPSILCEAGEGEKGSLV